MKQKGKQKLNLLFIDFNTLYNTLYKTYLDKICSDYFIDKNPIK